jgi:hypothetical protein
MLEDLHADRIIQVPRGSWRWQNAYAVARYRPQQTKDGRWIWKSVGRLTGKLSLPQLRKTDYRGLPFGSLHNRPIADALTPNERQAIANAMAGVDYRPEEMIPEDHYA